MPASDFTGCDPEVADSCEVLCQRADDLWLADLAATHDGEVRHAECTDLGCACRTVFRIDDRCYAADAPSARSYDCSASDEEILAMEYPADPAPCTAEVCDSGPGIPGP